VYRWRQTERSYPAILHMLHDIADCLKAIHQVGIVHRDLKPDNVLLMLQSQCWRLIDFGIAAPAGAHHLTAA
jgi:serine/threonine protein kinase